MKKEEERRKKRNLQGWKWNETGNGMWTMHYCMDGWIDGNIFRTIDDTIDFD